MENRGWAQRQWHLNQLEKWGQRGMGKREDMPGLESQWLPSAEEADCAANEIDKGREGGLGCWINSVDWILLHTGSH